MKKGDSEIKLAPIVFFAYNRPEHTKRSIESLKKNKLAGQSELFVFSDGPKADYDSKKVSEVRRILDGINGFKNVTIIKREHNYGLAKNIIEGVTQVVNSHRKVIVVECDLVLSSGFLEFMNNALSLYENDEKVMQISGYVYPVKTKLPETFFLTFGSCWGWATWDRAWKHFVDDAEYLINKITSQQDISDFGLGGSYNAYEQLLLNYQGKLKTWAIKWHSAIFLNKGLTLFPYPSLVNNMGSDNSGVHRENTDSYFWDVLVGNVMVKKIEIKESALARRKFTEYFNRFKYPAGVLGTALCWAKKSILLKRLLELIEKNRYSDTRFFRFFVGIKDFLFGYFFRKSGDEIYQKLENVPWWNQKAVEWLSLNLRPYFKVFEWGSGGSTIYISRRVKEVVSVEHRYNWHKKVAEELEKENIFNCRCVLVGPDKVPHEKLKEFSKKFLSSNVESRGYSFEKYINFIDDYPDNYFDVVIVDGRARSACIEKAVNKIKNGGFIVLDDSEREEYFDAGKILENFKRTNLFDPKSKNSVTSVWTS